MSSSVGEGNEQAASQENVPLQVRSGETAETNTAACGSLILEMGMLSRLTGGPD